MSKFKRSGKGSMTAISTASLPDIVFMLLFFFMVTTVMKENMVNVEQDMPFATEVKKLEKKSLVSYIYIGAPSLNMQSTYGTAPRIQLNDAFAPKEKIAEYIISEREPLSENDRKLMTVSLKVDGNVKMGIVTDVKQELRKASALKINYSAKKGTKEQIYSSM
jgi:biopolymer transport protein ExbD